jgi:hypothetical protein
MGLNDDAGLQDFDNSEMYVKSFKKGDAPASNWGSAGPWLNGTYIPEKEPSDDEKEEPAQECTDDVEAPPSPKGKEPTIPYPWSRENRAPATKRGNGATAAKATAKAKSSPAKARAKAGAAGTGAAKAKAAPKDSPPHRGGLDERIQFKKGEPLTVSTAQRIHAHPTSVQDPGRGMVRVPHVAALPNGVFETVFRRGGKNIKDPTVDHPERLPGENTVLYLARFGFGLPNPPEGVALTADQPLCLSAIRQNFHEIDCGGAGDCFYICAGHAMAYATGRDPRKQD